MKKKKVKEGSSASSTDDTDVFGEGLESTDCKAILLNYLKSLKVKAKKFLIWLTLQMKIILKENSN